MEVYLDDNDTVEKLRHQLNIYKSLNHDLSKKVQDMKIQSAQMQKELANVQKQLLEEQQKVKEYKRYLNTINSQCFQFCTQYFNTVNDINEENPDISLNFPKQGATPSAVQPKQIVKPPRRYSLPNDAEMLGAITEESVNMQTSTPFHPQQIRKLNAHQFMKSFNYTSSSVSN